MIFQSIKNRLAAFQKCEDGSLSVEFLLILPLLLWVFLSTFIYFEAFRVEANSNRAAITIAEMFSREEAPITEEYIDSARSLLRALTYEEANPDIRVSVYAKETNAAPYQIVWSRTRDYGSELTDADLLSFDTQDALPLLNDVDHAILVETGVDYAPSFKVPGPLWGLWNAGDVDYVRFNTFIVIRPRPSQLCFDEDPADDDKGLICDIPSAGTT